MNLVDDAWTHFPSYSGLVGCPSIKNLPPDGTEAYVAQLNILDLPRQARIRALVYKLVTDKETAQGLNPWYLGWCKRPCFHEESSPPSTSLTGFSAVSAPRSPGLGTSRTSSLSESRISPWGIWGCDEALRLIRITRTSPQVDLSRDSPAFPLSQIPVFRPSPTEFVDGMPTFFSFSRSIFFFALFLLFALTLEE